MSEYQYFEFQAIDRALTSQEMKELRSCSSRARITPYRFTNVYHFGDFKGNPTEWMKLYFDAYLYDSNFGSRVFMLRFPIDWLEEKAIKPYEVEGALELTKTATHWIISFILDTDPPDYYGTDESEEQLANLLPLRSAIAAGDHRALYMMWLSAVERGLLESTTLEPPVPSGLGNCDSALHTLMEFFSVSEDLLGAAATQSRKLSASPVNLDISKWLGGIDGEEKDSWLASLLLNDDLGLKRKCLLRFHQDSKSAPHASASARSVELLLADAEDIEIKRVEKQRQEAYEEECARITSLTGQEANLWQLVLKLSESSSSRYQDNAIRTLKDLRHLALLQGISAEFEKKLSDFIELRRRKTAFMKLMKQEGMI
jgi:hypothetical protein